jgi:hypothetical protein
MMARSANQRCTVLVETESISATGPTRKYIFRPVAGEATTGDRRTGGS